MAVKLNRVLMISVLIFSISLISCDRRNPKAVAVPEVQAIDNRISMFVVLNHPPIPNEDRYSGYLLVLREDGYCEVFEDGRFAIYQVHDVNDFRESIIDYFDKFGDTSHVVDASECFLVDVASKRYKFLSDISNNISEFDGLLAKIRLAVADAEMVGTLERSSAARDMSLPYRLAREFSGN